MYKEALDWIRSNAEKHGDAAELMRLAGAAKPSWYKLLQGKDVRAVNFMAWLENLGFRLVAPGGEILEGAPHEDCIGLAAASSLLAHKRRAVELEGKLALMEELYGQVQDEIAELKANSHSPAQCGRPKTRTQP